MNSETFKALRQTQNELQRRNSELISEKQQHFDIKKSLEYEFSAHGKTEDRLQKEYELTRRILAFLDSQFRTQTDGKDIGLGSALMENLALMEGLEKTNLELQNARNQIGEKDELLQQKEQEIQALKGEITQCCSDVECGRALAACDSSE